jgi:hypothetical protein
MHRLLPVLILLLLLVAPCAFSADVRPGDQVRFIEREQHIPAHPGPGDSSVHLPFVSGSEATVLQVNAATGWIEVRSEPLQGTEDAVRSSSITSSSTGGCCPGWTALRSGTSPTARRTRACGVSSPTTARWRSSCGSGEVATSDTYR